MNFFRSDNSRSHTVPRTGMAVVVVLTGFLVAGCGAARFSSRDGLPRYEAAIYDAAVYSASDLRTLRPLAFDSATQTTTVVTLTSYTGYTMGKNVLQRDVWVTGVPEVQEICRTFTGDLAMRLRQLLGLPPDAKFTNFVVMSVGRQDVFRPAADPTVTTTLPCADPSAPGCGESFPSGTSPTHTQWIAEQMLDKYRTPNGYPWTRLGYTYDWAADSAAYGASEYIVRKGSTVNVVAIIPYEDYCAPTSN